MLCESPKSLAEKYKEYAHGDPRKERRVVLDQTMLPAIKSAKNIRVVPKEHLAERFIKTVEEQSCLAHSNDETLIVMIFSHGESHSHGVYLGGKDPQDDRHILKIERLKRCFLPHLNVTLLLTPCYYGGW